MATGFVDCGALANVSDFTVITAGAGFTNLDLFEDGGDGQVLRLTKDANAQSSVVRYDPAGTAGTECEIVALLRYATAPGAGTNEIWPGVRVVAASDGWYAGEFDSNTPMGLIARTPQDAVNTFTPSPNTPTVYHWIRIRVSTESTTSRIQVRMWAEGGEEPGTWLYNATHNNVQGAGGIGFGGRTISRTAYIKGFGWANDGETAPTSGSASSPLNKIIMYHGG